MDVPVDTTIQFIIRNVYDQPGLSPFKIPKKMLTKLLIACTTQVPFPSPDGRTCVQIEGVAMGSPLGPTFANFYIGNLEELIFSDINIKPSIYWRYVDDIFVVVN